MRDFKRTKLYILLSYSGVFVLFFLVLGISFVSYKYVSNSNQIVISKEAAVISQPSEYGEEIDSIMNILEQIDGKTEKEEEIIKKYTQEEYKKDIFYIILGIIFFGFIFLLISIKIIGKILKPFEENLSDMKNFIDNAGHELKTPLAIIDSSLWIMKEKKNFEIDLINKSQKEIERTNKLIETLRDLSNITSISKKESFMVGKELELLLARNDENFKKRNITFKFHIVNDFEILCNKNYFHILFQNIISNATKYNKESGEITITVLDMNVAISDTGIGIPKEKLGKIFNRFYRVKEHRDTEGFGLGLSLVEKILQMYNWNIKVYSTLGEGTKIIIKF